MLIRRSLLFLLILTTTFLSGGCQTVKKPEPVKPGPRVTAVPRSQSAKAPIFDARRAHSAADKHNDTARAELTTAEARLLSYRAGEYQKLKALVTRLKEQGSAAVEELQELYDRVAAQDNEIGKLLTRLKTISDELKSEKQLREEVAERLVEAQARIAVKDKENDTLRGQFADMKQTAADYEANAKKNHDAAVKAKGDVEYLRGKNALLTKLLIGVCIALLISLALHYFRFKRGLLPI